MYKVIVIDDEMLVRRGIVMETDWQALNCVVVAEAGNGIEGLEAVRKYHPDLLICDIRMPKMDGIEMLKDEPLPELVLNKGDKSKYVMAAVDYISAHYGNPELCVAEIAEHLGISEGHLSHTFKRETDYTVAAYITRVRMRTAMKLLNDCRNKVYEVAEQVGYRDVAHFSSSSKRIVGVTPSEYQDRSM